MVYPLLLNSHQAKYLCSSVEINSDTFGTKPCHLKLFYYSKHVNRIEFLRLKRWSLINVLSLNHSKHLTVDFILLRLREKRCLLPRYLWNWEKKNPEGGRWFTLTWNQMHQWRLQQVSVKLSCQIITHYIRANTNKTNCMYLVDTSGGFYDLI